MGDYFTGVDCLLFTFRVDADDIDLQLVACFLRPLVVADDLAISDELVVRSDDVFAKLRFRNHDLIVNSASEVKVGIPTKSSIRTIFTSLLLKPVSKMSVPITTATTATAVAQGGSAEFSLLSSAIGLIAGIAVSFVAAVLVYVVRQYWEGEKLRKALVKEVGQMEGIENCADHVEGRDDPSVRPFRPKDVPAAGSIPTIVYKKSALKLGLLGGLLGRHELEDAVDFYSKVMRYKSIIERISSGAEVSDPDQEDLYDSIEELSDDRNKIIEEDSFNN